MNEKSSPADVMIRAGAVPRDVERCAEIWVRALEARDGSVDEAMMTQRVRQAFADADIIRFAVATSPRDGFALLETAEPGTSHSLLHFLAVDPAGEGSGTGRALLRDAIAHAKAAGSQRVILDVRPSNARAISLYSDVGFLPSGAEVPHPTAFYPMQRYELDLH